MTAKSLVVLYTADEHSAALVLSCIGTPVFPVSSAIPVC